MILVYINKTIRVTSPEKLVSKFQGMDIFDRILPKNGEKCLS